jgi:SAM-dependent methyltransferase
VLRERYLASETQDLAEALAETLSTIAPDRLDRDALVALESSIVRALQRLRGRRNRDPLGLVLTPVELATAAGALAATVDPDAAARIATVLDPACGTGRLLAAGASALVPGVRRVGWDVDPAALALARSLASARARLGDEGDIELFERDGLVASRPSVAPGSLAVLCHPPDVNAHARRSAASRIDGEGNRDLPRGRSVGPGSLSVAFVTRMVRDILRPGEVGVFVLPEELLDAPRHASFRSALLEHVDEMVIGRFPGRVPGNRTLRFVGVRRAHESLFTRSPVRVDVRFAEWNGAWTVVGALDGRREIPGVGAAWPWPTPNTASVWRLVDSGARLGTVVSAHDGIRIGRREDHRGLVSQKPRSLQRPRPLIGTRDVDSGFLRPTTLWLDYRPDRVAREAKEAGTSLKDAALFRGSRVYLAQHEHGASCVHVEDDSVARSPVYVLRWQGEGEPRAQLRALSAILSTDAVADIAEALFSRRWSAQRGLQLREIESLPVPWPPPRAVLDAAERWSAAPGEGRLRHVDTLVRRWLDLEES